MAKKITYDEGTIVAHLLKVKGNLIKIDTNKKIISIPKNCTDLGIHTQGKISFLVNVCKYLKHYVSPIEISANKQEKKRKNKKEMPRKEKNAKKPMPKAIPTKKG